MINISLAGIGGQGSVLAAKILAETARSKGWQVRSAEQPVTIQVLDYLDGLIPFYESQHVMLISLSGFASELKSAVQAGKLRYQVVLWGPDEMAAMLLSQRERLSAPLREALALG